MYLEADYWRAQSHDKILFYFIYKFFDHDKIVYLEADYWRAQSHDKIGLGAQEGGEHDCKVVY